MGNGWAVFGKAVGIVGLVAAGLIVGRGGLNVGPYQSWPSITQPGYPAGYPAYYPPPVPQPQLPPGYVWQGPGQQPSYGAAPAQWQVPQGTPTIVPASAVQESVQYVPRPAHVVQIESDSASGNLRLIPISAEATEAAPQVPELPPLPQSFPPDVRRASPPAATITRISQGDTIYRAGPVELTQRANVTVSVELANPGASVDNAKLLITHNNGSAPVEQPVTPTPTSTGKYDLTVQLPPTTQEVAFRVDGNATPSNTWKVSMPDDSQLREFTGFAASNNQWKLSDAVTANTNPLNIYGRFLRINGRSAPGTTIGAILERGEKGSYDRFADLALRSQPSVNSDWTYLVDVPTDLPPGFEWRIKLSTRAGKLYRYCDIPLKIKSSSFPGITPVITKIIQDTGTKTEMEKAPDREYFNQASIAVVAEASQAAGLPQADVEEAIANGVFVLLANGQLVSDSLAEIEDAPAYLSWTIPTKGTHSLQLGLVYGDTMLKPVSQPKLIRFRTAGPVPIKAAIVGSSRSTDSGTIRVDFDPESPLNPETIDAENFVLTRTRKRVRLPPETLTVKNKDPGGTFVELTVAAGLEADDYTLTLLRTHGGQQPISDVFGNPLGQVAGNNDGRTSISVNFSYGLAQGGSETLLDEPLTQQRGLSGHTGKNIEFPEYTEPRKSTTGFNPSDKVVSRVARLYYYRDAHRVTQLINRTAESFNRQAVTQQQQLADNSRRDARNFTDQRREAETEAVRAAQQARAAEAALLQAQQALAEASTELKQLKVSIAEGNNGVRDAELLVKSAKAEVAEKESLVQSADQEVTAAKGPASAAQVKIETAKRNVTTAARAKSAADEKLAAADAAAKAAPEGSQAKTEAEAQLVAARNEVASAQQTLLAVQRKEAEEEEDAAPDLAKLTIAEQRRVGAQKELDNALAAQAGKERLLLSAQDAKASLEQRQADAASRQQGAQRLVGESLKEIAKSRETEINKADQLQSRQALEDRAYDTLFRREVAAANEDPDTYAAGNPESKDPVAQVSISVVGEGVIQLRGPIKGVNLARMQIHDLDAPVGQVKVAVHTVQVNGERGDRIEPVVERIQRYVDHSRFLTSQSAQMLRRAVTEVASRRAEMVFAECEGLSQYERDQRYIEAFFGQQFLAELRELDSEFLRTGNKILSLHSMDTTSLAQCLFLMSLAKNDIRMEILTEFERLVTCQLPMDEVEYFDASNARKKFGHLFHKQKFQFFAQNARFVSLRGMYQAEVAGPDTLTPMQREFIRLAQIFKSRLITEIEFKQRVMERAIIEERVGDYRAELEEAFERDKDATAIFEAARLARQEQQARVAQKLFSIIGTAQDWIDQTGEVKQSVAKLSDFNGSVAKYTDTDNPMKKPLNELTTGTLAALRARNDVNDNTDTIELIENAMNALDSPGPYFWRRSDTPLADTIWKARTAILGEDASPLTLSFKIGQFTLVYKISTDGVTIEKGRSDAVYFARQAYKVCDNAQRLFSYFHLTDIYSVYGDDVSSSLSKIKPDIDKIQDSSFNDKLILDVILDLKLTLIKLDRIASHVSSELAKTRRDVEELVAEMASRDADVTRNYLGWIGLRARIINNLNQEQASVQVQLGNRLVDEVDNDVRELIARQLATDTAKISADARRRPLDHKKFLDMLVDDVEDKYIELLDGTRAQIANVDNYISRVITALDDDFNTQFYLPAFQQIRLTSQFYDVQVGQVETTSVLTNNRQFAKVSPQAVMEFDLPKRDILISEAFESAGAIYQDYGALLADPTFLSLTKLYSGQPTSSLTGAGLPNSIVRDVLPGLPASTDEQMLIQQGAQSPDFPSALESLIPDPAIYKFETGTGFEVRPVLQPDGQAVTFHLNYMYTTNIREPVRADEKHLGRIKRHFIDTDVQLGNFELREVSKYNVALKASRTARGVPLLEDVPVAGVLFRPLPQQQSSLQQNIILSQATIFPTLFDLMGLRWAPAVADLDAQRLQEEEFVGRGRQEEMRARVFDYSSDKVDEFLRIQPHEQRRDLYRAQQAIPLEHPSGHVGPASNREAQYGTDGIDMRHAYPADGVMPAPQEPHDRDSLLGPGDYVPPGYENAPVELAPPPPPAEAASRSKVQPRTTPSNIRPASAPQRLSEPQGPPPSRPRSPVNGPALNPPAGDRPGASFLPPTSQSAPPASRPAPQPGVSRRLPTFSTPKPPTSRPTTDRAEPKAAVVPVSGTKETQMEPAVPTKSKSWFRIGSSK